MYVYIFICYLLEDEYIYIYNIILCAAMYANSGLKWSGLKM